MVHREQLLLIIKKSLSIEYFQKEKDQIFILLTMREYKLMGVVLF